MKNIVITSIPFLYVEVEDKLKTEDTRVVCLKDLQFICFQEDGFISFKASLEDPVLDSYKPEVVGKIKISPEGTLGEIRIEDEHWGKIEEGKYWYRST